MWLGSLRWLAQVQVGLARRGFRLTRPGAMLTRTFLLVLAVLVIASAAGQTIAYFTSAQSVGSNTLSSAKAFSIADVSATAEASGAIVIKWSAASWATGGYSIRRNT